MRLRLVWGGPSADQGGVPLLDVGGWEVHHRLIKGHSTEEDGRGR
jgi:hypothetical protein